MSDQERLQEIRARADAAWHGDWKTTGGYSDQVFTYNPDGSVERHVCDIRGWGHFTGKGSDALHLSDEAASAQMQSDAEFVAHARQDIPYLLGLVESLQRENEALNRCALMRDGVVVPAKEYEPITFCGVPIADAVEIVESNKRDLSMRGPAPVKWETKVVSPKVPRARLTRFKGVKYLPGGIESTPTILDGYLYWLERPRQIAFKCPCGCGNLVLLDVSPTMRSHKWKLEEVRAGYITLEPSIQNVSTCGSHYYIRENQVLWMN